MNDQAMHALTELVRLHRLKQAAKAMNPQARGAPGRKRAEMLQEYERLKVDAWIEARRVVDEATPRG